MPRGAAALSLSGRYAPFGRQAAAGLRAWAARAGASLRLEDDGSDPARSARLASELARGADLLFGPYGSGAARAVADAMEDRPEVVWNHGGAEVPRRTARLVDVLGPAGSYWRGVPAVLGRTPAAVVRGPGGFGAAVALGAERALAAAGTPPVLVLEMQPDAADDAAREAREAGAQWVVAGGRAEDELALARALIRGGLRGALVVCGVELAARELGGAITGWLGPAQWAPGGPPPPVPLPPGADYPAAQAVAAGLVAAEALDLAGSARPDDLWDAARALETSTFLGPFAVDREGRQVAHAPLIVRWEGRGSAMRREVAWRPG